MSMRLMIAFSLLALIVAPPVARAADAPAGRPPNIIFILADDLGYGDLSCYGQQKFRTPGIDRFYGYNCQGVAHNYYPTYLWDNDKKVPLDNPQFSAHQKWPAGADPTKPESYQRFIGKQYAPDLIGEQARAFLRDNKDKPF